MNPGQLIDLSRRNLETVTGQSAGLSDEQANRQAGQGASLNWTVGHILATRTRLMMLLGHTPDMAALKKLAALYGTRTKPDASGALPLAQLLQQLEETQAPLEAGLQAADLTPIVESPFGLKPLGDLINFFVWHEGYHAGQTVIFRPLALD